MEYDSSLSRGVGRKFLDEDYSGYEYLFGNYIWHLSCYNSIVFAALETKNKEEIIVGLELHF